MDPDGAMFSDWAGFTNLLAGYLAGKLYYTTIGGLRIVFRAPEYLAQIGTVVDSEQYMLLLICNFFYDFFGNMFKDWTSYLHTIVCGAMCSWHTEVVGRSGWGPSGWIAGVAAVATSALTRVLGCDCGAVGGSYKKRKATRRKNMQRRSTRKQRGGDKEHIEFISLMWNALLFYSAPAITNGAVKPSPAMIKSVDEHGSAALVKLISTGAYIPPFWIEGVDDLLRLPDAGLLALKN